MCVPIVVAISLAADVLAMLTTDLTPVARLFAHGHMAEARCFSLARVVATPVQEYDAQHEPAQGVIDIFGMILGPPPTFPQQQVIRDCVHDCGQVGCFVLHTYEHGLVVVCLPVVAWYQGSEVSVPKLHGQLIG